MIKTHEQILVPDINRENPLVVEVNWNPKDKKTNECKVVRLIYPNGQTALVKREHLHGVLFSIGREEDQQKLVPQTLTRIRNYETMLGITATKNIAKGEKINVHVKIPIPLTQDDVYAGARSSKKIIT